MGTTIIGEKVFEFTGVFVGLHAEEDESTPNGVPEELEGLGSIFFGGCAVSDDGKVARSKEDNGIDGAGRSTSNCGELSPGIVPQAEEKVAHDEATENEDFRNDNPVDGENTGIDTGGTTGGGDGTIHDQCSLISPRGPGSL